MDELFFGQNQVMGSTAYFFSTGVALQLQNSRFIPHLIISLGTQSQILNKVYESTAHLDIGQRQAYGNIGYSFALIRRLKITPYLGVRLISSNYTFTNTSQNVVNLEEMFSKPSESYSFKLRDQIFMNAGIQFNTPIKTTLNVDFVPHEFGLYADYMQSINQPTWRVANMSGKRENLISNAFNLGFFFRWNIF